MHGSSSTATRGQQLSALAPVLTYSGLSETFKIVVVWFGLGPESAPACGRSGSCGHIGMLIKHRTSTISCMNQPDSPDDRDCGSPNPKQRLH